MEVRSSSYQEALSNPSFKQRLQSRYGPGISDKFRGYEKIKLKLTKEETHIAFLCRARDNNIIPNGFRLKSSVSGSRPKRILQRASFALIKSEINHHKWKVTKLSDDAVQRFEEIKRITLEEDWRPATEKIEQHCRKVRDIHNRRHEDKWNRLAKQEHQKCVPRETQGRKTIVNISSKSLTTTEENLLQRGLNFAVAPKNIPTLDIISAIETTSNFMEPVQAEEFRWKIRNILEKNEKPRPNITKAEERALKYLQKDETIKILPADKGNATVIMDTEIYNEKIQEVLKKGDYRQLPKDPTTSIERKVYLTLRKYQGYIANQERTKLTPHHSKPPHLYGLPKIHKEDIPLRPITSSRDSPTYNLAKYLLPIIQPLQGKSPSYIKNSQHFVEIIKTIDLAPEDSFYSFDVESLYTNVPVDETLKIIKQKLEDEENLKNLTNLPISGIMELLECCLRNAYFQEKDVFYSQNNGLPMGSPLSPVVANIYMEWFENHAIQQTHQKPKRWLRYVDDTFIIWNHSEEKIHQFLEHINNIRPTIKFTMEKEENGSLPFLDVKVERTENGELQTSVYRKKTHTGQYLNFTSNHPSTTKTGIIRTLVQRAKEICSNQQCLDLEVTNIKEDLRRNGYPTRLIEETLQNPRQEHSDDKETTTATVLLPYVRGTSEKIRRIGRQYNIKTYFQTRSTLRGFLTHTKPKQNNKKNCIYQVPCQCGDSYIGETKRPLEVRLREHRTHTQRGETTKSGIADHVWREHHDMNWSEAKVIASEEHWYRRKFKEAAFIGSNSRVFSQPSIEIKNVWKPILSQLDELKIDKARPARSTAHDPI